MQRLWVITFSLTAVIALSLPEGKAQDKLTGETSREISLPPVPSIDPMDSIRLWQIIATQMDSTIKNEEEYRKIFLNTLKRSRDLQFNTGVSASAMMLARLYLQQAAFQQSIEMNLLAIQYAPNSHYGHQIISNAYQNIANAYNSLEKPHFATYYYFRLAHFLTDYQQGEKLEFVYTSLSSTLPTDFALKYLNKAEELARLKNNDSLLCIILINRAYHLQKKNLTDSMALISLEEALAIGNTIDNIQFRYRALVRLAAYYLELDSTQKAVGYLKEAEKLMPHGDQNIYYRNRDHHIFAKAWEQLGNYNKAEEYVLRARETAEKLQLPSQLSIINLNLSKLAERRGDLKSALNYLRIHLELKDSVLNSTVISNIQDLEFKYRTAEKDKELVQKEKALERQNTLIAGVAAGSLILLAGSLFYYRTARQKQKLLQQKQELLRLKSMMEGEEIERSRIARELHDGIMVNFSSVKMNLGAILKKYPDSKQTEELKEIISQLDDATRELRKSAHNLMPDMLLQEGLYAAVSYFCHSISQNTGVEVEFNHFGPLPNIPSHGALLLYRTVQELLQNALKYAEATHIIVQIDNMSDLISITVEDNGKGFNPEILVENRGMGLRNIRSRIESLGGIMTLETSEGKGASIYIELETVSLHQDINLNYGDKSIHNR